MINYDSILSAFDGKPTLLQWLKLVKKALDESVLKDITVSQDGASAVFTFNFEDGTSLSTPAVTLPKGETGAKGDKGDEGEQGVSVTGVDEVSNEVVGSQTLTTLRFNFSNGTNNEVVVHAENGKNASGPSLYNHLVYLEGRDAKNYLLTYYSGSEVNDTNETLIAYAPVGGVISVINEGVNIYKGILSTAYAGPNGYIAFTTASVSETILVKVLSVTVTPYNSAV